MRFRRAALAAATVLALAVSQGAHAQSPVVGSTGDVDVSVVRAKITHVDSKHRAITVRGPAGNVFEVAVGPEVRNFNQIKAGDEIVLRYAQSIAIVITKPGTKLPDFAVGDAGARAAPGEKPAGAAGRRVAITGLIVGVDPVGHILSVVDQHGGPVRNLAVLDPERQVAMKSLKVGEMITVIYTEAVAIAVEPAHKV